MSITPKNELIGVSHHNTVVSVWLVDLPQLTPFREDDDADSIGAVSRSMADVSVGNGPAQTHFTAAPVASSAGADAASVGVGVGVGVGGGRGDKDERGGSADEANLSPLQFDARSTRVKLEAASRQAGTCVCVFLHRVPVAMFPLRIVTSDRSKRANLISRISVHQNKTTTKKLYSGATEEQRGDRYDSAAKAARWGQQ